MVHSSWRSESSCVHARTTLLAPRSQLPAPAEIAADCIAFQIQHFDGLREAFALTILCSLHHFCQLPTCLGRFKIDAQTNDVRCIQFRPLSGITAKAISSRRAPLTFCRDESSLSTSTMYRLFVAFCPLDLNESSRPIYYHAITMLL